MLLGFAGLMFTRERRLKRALDISFKKKPLPEEVQLQLNPMEVCAAPPRPLARLPSRATYHRHCCPPRLFARASLTCYRFWRRPRRSGWSVR